MNMPSTLQEQAISLNSTWCISQDISCPLTDNSSRRFIDYGNHRVIYKTRKITSAHNHLTYARHHHPLINARHYHPLIYATMQDTANDTLWHMQDTHQWHLTSARCLVYDCSFIFNNTLFFFHLRLHVFYTNQDHYIDHGYIYTNSSTATLVKVFVSALSSSKALPLCLWEGIEERQETVLLLMIMRRRRRRKH